MTAPTSSPTWTRTSNRSSPTRSPSWTDTSQWRDPKAAEFMAAPYRLASCRGLRFRTAGPHWDHSWRCLVLLECHWNLLVRAYFPSSPTVLHTRKCQGETFRFNV